MLFCDGNKVSASRMLSSLTLMLVVAIGAAGQSPGRALDLSGVVLDSRGAVIAEAKVTLRRDGLVTDTKTANQRGEFRFTRITVGD